ncbi:RHS repeat domain-containing protein, partial [Undibacterium crateris]|uniref:hypothetical protein n=1 Tax=Undibacterium crateris TaxID=2528175 RepID=UPI001F38A6CC
MGRLNRITPPADSNLAYYPTVLTFEPVGTDEYGLSPGHWRQTTVTGNAVTIHYFDAMWRKRISKTYDAANPGATQTMLTYQWDAEGRLTYQSFPQANIADIYTTNGIYGQRQWYDALGRITDVWSDSELGILKKRTDYLTGFQTQTTDARGNTSTQTHLAYDDPAQAWLSRIRAPQGLNLDIVRDVFGKPLSITRSGTNAGTTTSVTRVYVYDANQRLCKTIEPELGASLQDWDAAGNLAWKSGGTSLTSQACDRANVAGSSKISHSYDARNRLDSTRYGDGSPAIVRRYTPDGLLSTVDNGVSRWSYAYNNRRLLNRETLQFNNHEWNLFHIPDAYGHTAALYYPDGTQIAYAPNALGQATQVGAYASAITYHPNGEVASYRYGNGIAHSVTQNLRGLPATLSDAGISANQYGYDQNANVSTITDLSDGSTSRSMQYDALDRLIAVNAPGLWGQASYAYDVQDNLRQSSVGARNLTHQYDTNNRLSAISGSQNQSYTFDPNGNLSTRGNDRFSFDLANRLRSATTNAATASAAASYTYDGHGRRIFTARDNNPGRFQLYSLAGQQLWASGEQSASNYPASSNPTCPPGWTASANLCVRTETQSASLAYSCPNGGTLSGTVCNITTSTPATRTAYCPGDDSLRKRPASGSGATTRLLCPNMQWIYTCPNGGTLSGRQCLTTASQAASVTPSCPQGWNTDGQTCRRQLTQNPTPAYTCPDGGTLNGSTCTIAGGSYTTKYHYLAGKAIAEVSNGQVRYTHTDALGSPVAISDANGTLISRTRYEAYGNTHSGAVPGQA